MFWLKSYSQSRILETSRYFCLWSLRPPRCRHRPPSTLLGWWWCWWEPDGEDDEDGYLEVLPQRLVCRVIGQPSHEQLCPCCVALLDWLKYLIELFVNSVINCVKIDLIALFFISHCLLMIVLSKYPKDDDNPNFSTRGEDWAARLTFLYFCQEITRTSFGIIPSDNDNYSLKFSLSALQHVLLCGHRNKFCKFSTILGWYLARGRIKREK